MIRWTDERSCYCLLQGYCVIMHPEVTLLSVMRSKFGDGSQNATPMTCSWMLSPRSLVLVVDSFHLLWRMMSVQRSCTQARLDPWVDGIGTLRQLSLVVPGFVHETINFPPIARGTTSLFSLARMTGADVDIGHTWVRGTKAWHREAAMERNESAHCLAIVVLGQAP